MKLIRNVVMALIVLIIVLFIEYVSENSYFKNVENVVSGG